MKDSKKIAETSTVRAGFTLVELVVVIAILGILAGVAYPAYTGYIARANDAKITSALSNVVVTVESSLAYAGDDSTVKTITVAVADGKISATDSSDQAITLPDLTQFGGSSYTYNATDGNKIIIKDLNSDFLKKTKSFKEATSIKWSSEKSEWTAEPAT